MYNSNPKNSGMGKIASTLVVGLLLLFSSSSYATDVTGDITTNTTWNLAGSPYVLKTSITVIAGVTLIVDPGVTVQSGRYQGLFIKGTLDVNGNSSSTVTFTGTSNESGWWRGIHVSNNGSAYLDYTNILYGGYIDGVNLKKSGSGNLTLNHCNLSHGSSHGLKIDANTGALDANSCTFSNNAFSGVWLGLNMSSNFIDDNVVFNGNPRDVGIAGGTMTSNATWDLNSSYSMYLNDSLTVADSAVLTVAPGTAIKTDRYDGLFVQGGLEALGTASEPVYFTGSTEQSTWWRGIQVSGAGTATLNHTHISYGGYINGVNLSKSGSGSMTLNNSSMNYSSSHGLKIDANTGALDANSCAFSNNAFSGVWLGLNMSSDFIDDNVVFNGNPRDVGIAGGTMTSNATWDLSSNYSMYLNDSLTVADSAVLTVAPGTAIKTDRYDGLFVQGGLEALGTASEPVYFTGSTEQSTWWRGIQVSGTGTATLNHTHISYGGYINGVNLSKSGSGSMTLNNSSMNYSSSHGLKIDANTGALDANSCTFSNNAFSGVWLGLNMSSDFIDAASIFDNNARAIGIAGGTMDANVTWRLNPAYSMYLDNTLTVSPTGHLNIAPGTVIKSDRYDGIFVQGELTAQGTTGSPIYYTDARDDTVGGDANRDGDATLPGSGWWRGVQISGAGSATLKHAHIRYGGYIEGVNLKKTGTGSLSLVNSTLTNSSNTGLYVDNSTGAHTLKGNLFSDNKYGIKFVVPPSNTTVIASRMESNSLFGIHNSGPNEVDASNNWWGDPTGPQHATNPTGKGNPVSDLVLFEPWRTTSATSTIKAPIHSGAILEGDSLRFIGAASDDPSHTYLWDLAEGRSSNLLAPGIVSFHTNGSHDISFALVDDAGSPDPNPDTRQLSVQSDTGNVPDMKVTSLQAPPDLSIGQSASIAYSVKNIGSGALSGKAWEDALYLSTDEFLDSGDQLLATKEISETLATNSSYQDEFQIYVPAANEGQSYLIVSVDDNWAVLEQHQLNNESAASTSISVPVVQSGVGTAGVFSTESRKHYYRIDVTAGENILITLDDADDVGITELYVKHGALPTVADYDYRSNQLASADQQIIIPAAFAGSWYIMAYDASAQGSGAYTLTVEVSGMVLSGVTPDRNGNGTDAVLTLSGAGFNSTASVTLIASNGSPYLANDISIDSNQQITATFTAGSLPAGVYDVRVNQGSDTATLSNAFEIIDGGLGVLETKVIVPSVVGYHQLATLYVEYRNIGDSAIPAPLLMLTGVQNDEQKALLTLDKSRLTQGFWTTAVPEGFSNAVYFLGSGKSPGLLLPGEIKRVPIYYAGWQKPWDFSYPPIVFYLVTLNTDDTELFDWDGLANSDLVDIFEDGAHTGVLDNLEVNIGSTWGDFVAMLNANAAYLGGLGREVIDVKSLLAFEVKQADSYKPVENITEAMDSYTQAKDIPLILSRSYPNSITGRYKLGPFGRGWRFVWDIAIADEGDGKMVISFPDNQQDVYQPDQRGGYLSTTGDQSELSKLPDGHYVLKTSNGLVMNFNPDGTLNFIETIDGHRVTAGYTSGNMTSLSHSSGISTQLSYNGQGRIIGIEDATGRTTVYSYDQSGEHLISVRYPDQRSIGYSYVSGANAASEHALSEIEYLDGTHRFFTYDAFGRLISSFIDSGAQLITFQYGHAGRVEVIRNSASSQLFYDHFGILLKKQDPDGNTSYATIDPEGTTVEITNPSGHKYRTETDQQSKSTTITDPLGQKFVIDYSSPLGLLTSILDSRGNRTLYTRDARGNLTNTLHADGSSEKVSHNASGVPISWTNRRGDVIDMIFSNSGKMLSKSHNSVTIASAAYDANNKLISFSSDDGPITIAFNSNDTISRIDYPSSRSLTYGYDSESRVNSITDQLGYQVGYVYGVDGRLQKMTDQKGNVVSYVYDTEGNITKKTLGNGSYTTFVYDIGNRLQKLTNYNPNQSMLSQFTYTFGASGNITGITTLDGNWSYQYDAIEQLVQAIYTSQNAAVTDQTLDYEYDAMGNLISMEKNSVVTNYSVNQMNQYTQTDATIFDYDTDGNLISINENGETTTLVYDIENRLTSISKGGDQWNYEYNALGQRTSKTHNGNTSYYINDLFGRGSIVAEYDQSGSLVKRYKYGLDLTASSNAADDNIYYLFDGTGSTDSLVDINGNLLNKYLYAPFGDALLRDVSVSNEFDYFGQWGYQNDNNGLYYLQTRYYLASIMRFLNQDPIGTKGGFNLYRYVSNNPVNLVDPTGLFAEDGWMNWLFRTPEKIVSTVLDRGNYIDLGLNLGLGGIFGGTFGLIYSEDGLRAYYGGTAGWGFGANVHLGRTDNGKSPTSGKSVAVTNQIILGIQRGQTAEGDGFTAIAVGLGIGQTVASTYTTERLIEGWGTGDILRASIATIKFFEEVAQGISDFVFGGLDKLKEACGEIESLVPRQIASVDTKVGTAHMACKTPVKSDVAQSSDPNQKIGPTGGGTENYIGLNTAFPYRIDFENDDTATSPAQVIIITDQLHENLDWTTFEITEIGFADQLISVPPQSQRFAHIERFNVLGHDVEVHIDIELNPTSGMIQAVFSTIDPDTGLPPDVSVGFLPPEDGTGRGQGYFSYVIRPKSDLSSGDTITNIAVITFDFGERIATNQIDPHDPDAGTDPAKEAPNTIDAEIPTSSVQPLPATSSTNISVQWQGQDTGGSGIGGYSIYVQEDSGPFKFWTITSATSATYSDTTIGNHYGFYSRAIDLAGNMEADKNSAEATTLVDHTGDILCPGNGGLAVFIAEQIYLADEIYSCTAVNKITAGGPDQVIAKSGSSVTYTSSVIELLPIFRVESGASFRAISSPADNILMIEGPSPTPLIDSVRPLEEDVVSRVTDATIPEALRSILEAQQASASDLFADPQQNYVLFSTDAALVEQDYNQVSDIYLYQTWLDKMVLISRASTGASGNGPSIRPRMDSLVQRIVFESGANNLVSGDYNAESDIFLIELSNGKMERISGGHHAYAFNLAAEHPAMDGPGGEILYDAVDESGLRQIYGYETQNYGTRRMSSLHNEGVSKHNPAISADGQYIAYLETTEAEAEVSCMVHVDDRLSGIYRKVPCPSALTGESSFIPYFSDDASQLEWREEIPYMIGDDLRNTGRAVITIGNPFMQ